MSHILLLEPNTLLARTYAQVLTQAGHTVTPVRGAQQAIHAADQQMPDVVILELQLPAHNGIEFLHEFRSYPEWQHVPVIVNTTLAPALMQRYTSTLQRDLGVQVVLYKPTATLADLCRAVKAGVAAAA
ncbi:MAG TPA: response regulator [Candidatus Saccharimonadales bacterium]|jgi:CheY-like chemotaxis protein|nr:response regulator [Candidatus Saccharimonadales bacterium]